MIVIGVIPPLHCQTCTSLKGCPSLSSFDYLKQPIGYQQWLFLSTGETEFKSRQSASETVLGNPWLCSFHGPLDVLLLHPEVVGDVLAPERLPAALEVLLVQPHRLQLLHRDAFFQTGNCVICRPLFAATLHNSFKKQLPVLLPVRIRFK